jgi:hypothetical protein
VLTAAVYRLLRSCDVESPVAAACAAGCALSLPVAAFAFAFYPETCAALVVCVVVGAVVRPTRVSAASALTTGLLLGSLGWLHNRFLGLAVVGLGWVIWRQRRRPALLIGALA